MNNNQNPHHREAQPHCALMALMQAHGLRLVEMDQFVYPEEPKTPRFFALAPQRSLVYLQLVDAQKNVVAGGCYEHKLDTRSFRRCGK
jgi:hypothetical protein